jgi:carboxypeptidase Q
MKRSPLLAALLLATTSPALADPVADAREAALASDSTAWDVVEGITTEVGQRLAATPAEACARDWAVAKLKALGFANVHVEPFMMPVWVRGAETAEIVSPFPQSLVVAALGNSAPTPAAGITAEIVGFDGMDALRNASEASVRGKIVFVNHQMSAQQDGGSYGEIGAIRRLGRPLPRRRGRSRS